MLIRHLCSSCGKIKTAKQSVIVCVSLLSEDISGMYVCKDCVERINNGDKEFVDPKDESKPVSPVNKVAEDKMKKLIDGIDSI